MSSFFFISAVFALPSLQWSNSHQRLGRFSVAGGQKPAGDAVLQAEVHRQGDRLRQGDQLLPRERGGLRNSLQDQLQTHTGEFQTMKFRQKSYTASSSSSLISSSSSLIFCDSNTNFLALLCNLLYVCPYQYHACMFANGSRFSERPSWVQTPQSLNCFLELE